MLPLPAKLARFLPDWFLTGMVIAIGLAWLFPNFGGSHGTMHANLVNKLGVALIFFLHGLMMSFDAMKGGLRRWQAHSAIQLTTFVLFPLLGLLFYFATDGVVDPYLRLGFFFLCALPSTVSSSVAMTAAAQGDVPVAVFNAALSSLLGILLTPLWIALVTHQTTQGAPLLNTIEDLCLWLLLPLVIGQLLHPALGAWAKRHKKYVGKVDRLTILLLVYTSFCDSFEQDIWANGAVQGMATAVIATGVLLFIAIGGTWFICQKYNVAPALRSAIVFCASKKSLATGVPMAQLMFSGNPALVMILLPVMIYHPLQLFVCGPLASHWAKQAAQQEAINKASA